MNHQSIKMDSPTKTPKPKKKRLSGATMGMRFMTKMNNNTPKRDTTTNNNNNSNDNDDDNTTAEGESNGNSRSHGNANNEEEWEMNTNTNTNTNNETESSTKMDIDEEDDNTNNNTNNNPLYIEISKETTTQLDMYGIRSDIIGRRSFNNFNKSVEGTYQAAVYERRRNKIDKKVEKEHISDEELLKRYEHYVKGGNNGNGNGNKKKVNGIGNLKDKAAKRRKR